jgi:nucleoside-triphosphatase THEP1
MKQMLYPESYILSGPVGSGKTTKLVEWSSARKDVAGILTPVKEKKRVFTDVQSGEQWKMEALKDEQDPIHIGKYRFSRESFDRASTLLRSLIHTPGWLVIDEIGPLELKGEGFGFVLQDILKERKGKLLLVVREGLAERVIHTFRMSDVKVITIEETENLN